MSLCDVPGISTVCHVVGQGAADLVEAPFDWLASALGHAAGWVFQQVWSIFDATTMVDVTNANYRKVYALLFGVACMLMLILFCFQLITGLIRHEPGALGRAMTGLGKAVLGSFLILTTTGLLLQIVDQLCVGLVQATGNTMSGMGDKIAALVVGLTAINLAAPGAGIIITIFLAGLAISAAFVVWFSLLIRKALLLVALVFGPFAMAGASWDHAKGWFGKWASFVIAMILSKLVLVTILLIGVSMAASPLEPDLQSVSDAITGVVLMLIAAFAPYMTYKFIAFMGADMYHLMSAEQEAKSALDRPVPVKPTLPNPPSTLNSSGGDAPGSNPAPQHPAPTAAAPASEATTGAETAGASEGAAGAGAAGGAAAAAGPAAVAIVGAEVVEEAATAGPKLGGAVGGAASGQADAVEPTPAPTPSVSPAPTSVNPSPHASVPAAPAGSRGRGLT